MRFNANFLAGSLGLSFMGPLRLSCKYGSAFAENIENSKGGLNSGHAGEVPKIPGIYVQVFCKYWFERPDH